MTKGEIANAVDEDRVRGGLFELLDSSINLIKTAGDEYRSHAEKLSEIFERLTHGRINLAVLGQFKRGKSSLLNAILGRELLPTSVIPLTSIPTYIRYGLEQSVRIHYGGGKEDDVLMSDSVAEIRAFLARYVSEEQNPGNTLDVSGVEIFYDAPILRRGAVLIDTPGIGSTHLHNTEATLNFLPHCDAALFLVSADPPITEVEIDFLEQVRQRIGRIFFILNKVDYLTPSEREEVISFITRVLQDKAKVQGAIELIPVSARHALEAMQTNDTAKRSMSGIDVLFEALEHFMAREKQAVLNDALARKTADVLGDVEMQLELTLKAYREPAEELERKLALFEEKIREAEHQKTLSGDILAGERKRLLHLLEEQSESLRKKSRQHLEAILADYIAQSDDLRENDVREAFSKAIPVFFEHELGEMSAFFDKRVAEIIALHRRRADEIIDSVRRSASDIFDIPYRPHEGSEGIEFVREPYWVLHQWKSSLVPIPEEFIDRLVPKRVRVRRIRRRLEAQIHSLVMNNVENLRWSTLQNLDLTFRKFMSNLEDRFAAIIGVTREAIKAAYEKRKNYAEGVADEIARLERLFSRVSGMKQCVDSCKGDTAAERGGGQDA